ncbi:MAG: exodeoxyribonuclease V subunit beta [Syntrophales bacterium]|nr:exodeoxyribonuclease V subunit beta [Syntrophales bacterium]
MKTFDLLNSPLEGTHLIEAGAGTGKTYAIAFLFLRLLIEKKLKIGEILVLTYTNNATDELRDRIRTYIKRTLDTIAGKEELDAAFLRLREGLVDHTAAKRLLKEALRDFDEAAIFTIHGFCHKVLKDFAFECGCPMKTEVVEDDAPTKIALFFDFWRRHFYHLPTELLSAFHARIPKLFPLLMEIALNFPRDPSIIFKIPDETTHPPDLDRLRSLFTEIFHVWQEEKALIVEEICRITENKREEIISKLSFYFSDTRYFPLLVGTENLALSKYTKKKKSLLSHRFFRLLDEFESARKKVVEDANRYLNHLIHRLLLSMRNELPTLKGRLRELSFDDLLLELHRSITDNNTGPLLKKAIKEHYKAALVDEFQDTDPVQYEIIKSIFEGESSLFLIGDPRQAIYSFRGADLFTYVSARQQLNENNIYTLTDNHRSTPGLIKAVNSIFSNHPNPFVFPEIKFIPSRSSSKKAFFWPAQMNPSPLQLWYFKDDYLESKNIKKSTDRLRKLMAIHLASEVGCLLEAGSRGEAKLDGKPLEPEDIVILVRHRYDATIVQQTLSDMGIKSVFQRMGPLFETEEARACFLLLQAILEPHRRDLLKAALSTDIMGQTASEIFSDDGERYFTSFNRYRFLWERKGFLPMFRELIREHHVRERLLMTENGERKLTNLLQLGEILHEREAKEALLPSDLVKWLSDKINDDKKRVSEYELRLESDEGAVVISTIHGAKGLEFPVVFCPYLWIPVRKERNDEAFTVYHETDGHKWHKTLSIEKTQDIKELAWRETFAEECRLLYVALTRAVYRCYVFWGRVPRANTSPLAYVLHYRTGDVRFDDLAKFMEELEEKDIIEDLYTLSRLSSEEVHFAMIEDLPVTHRYEGAREKTGEFKIRTAPDISRRVEKTVSFTLLTTRREEEDYLDLDLPSPLATPPEHVDPVFLFPSGLRAGLVLHRIMEKLDYANFSKDRALSEIRENLRLFGFSSDWEGAIWLMISRALTTPLDGSDGKIILSHVRPQDRLPELSFTLPVTRLTIEKLSAPFTQTAFAEYIDRLSFPPYKGFLRGFIDLVFRFEGRYYLLDWKTNHLGYEFTDYTPARLETIMGDHFYFLQYHFYLLALHQHLKRTLSNYDYEEHMGGIFYVFMRGINPDPQIRSGIYEDLPPLERIKQLEQALLIEV